MLHIKVKNIIKNRSLVITKNRINVLKVFIKSGKPLSLKEIRLSINNIDRVTLFRILSVFEENKIIHTINLDNVKKLYALCNQECESQAIHTHNHIHFYCEDCNDVFCLPINKFPKLSVPNYIFNNLSISAYGKCSNCNL